MGNKGYTRGHVIMMYGNFCSHSLALLDIMLWESSIANSNLGEKVLLLKTKEKLTVTLLPSDGADLQCSARQVYTGNGRPFTDE